MALMLMTVTASCSSSRNNATQNLHPNDVFTVTEDDIANETRMINHAFQGEWKYNGPSVGLNGKNLLSGIAKPIAKNKLKKKLKNAFKKIGLNKARPEFMFDVDGTCSVKMLGMSMNGTYTYNPDVEKITI